MCKHLTEPALCCLFSTHVPPWVSILWAWPVWREKTVINHKCVSFYCEHKPAWFVVAISLFMKGFADSSAVVDMSFSAWVGLFLRNACKANMRVKVKPHYDKIHISWMISEKYKRRSHLRTLNYSSLSLSHTCSVQIVRSAEHSGSIVIPNEFIILFGF